MRKGEKVYFVSDAHLGIPDYYSSLKREKRLVQWLDSIRKDAKAIYLLGDIFDFWFEYSMVVPKGFVRLFGKIAQVADEGIPVYYFTGNHDMWVSDYFITDLGITVLRQPIDVSLSGRKFHIGHGDGLGPGDKWYKIIKKIFSCRLCQRLFASIHPAVGMRLALFFSRRSRLANRGLDEHFLGKDREWLIQYCLGVLKTRPVDFFVFGHRHLPLNIEIAPGVRYVNTGDWVKEFSFAVFDGETIELARFPDHDPEEK